MHISKIILVLTDAWLSGQDGGRVAEVDPGSLVVRKIVIVII